MAIVKMKRMTLLAMQADKDKIFDALIRSNVVQLKRTAEVACCQTENPSVAMEKLLEKAGRAEESIAYLTAQTEAYNAENKRNPSVQKAEIPKTSLARPLMEIDFDFFLGFGKEQEELENQLNQLAKLRDKANELTTLLKQNEAEKERFLPLKDLPHPTTWYQNTSETVVQLSQLPASEWQNLVELSKEYDLADVEKICENSQTVVVAVVAHKSQAVFLERAASLGLAKCGVSCSVLPRLILKDLDSEKEKLQKQLSQIKAEIVSFDKYVPQWKIYVDWLNLCVKKAEANGDLQQTEQTFILEGFYPAEEEDRVKKAVQSVSDCIVVAFHEIAADEFAPTLTKNNKLVKNFEAITNMYTPPDYHEIDPNPVVTVFYFIIFGFMVADMGYGLLLMCAGLFAHFYIKQQTGIKTLLQIFGFCGIAAVAAGALFGTFFSYALYPGIIPDPSQYPMLTIILSLLLGVCHIMAGVCCKMAVKYKQKQKLSAWLADFPWLFVLAGLVLAIWNSAVDMASYEPYQVLKIPQTVADAGLYVCLASLAVALVFAGAGTKGFKGKVTKSLGSMYGIINYFSDVMSYIRVFGLMLSSALIGSVVNMLAEMVSSGGGVTYVFCALILIVFHLFNLVMGVLSVYIHNGRLQYVEFFGKFYTGDGVLFVPFGSDTKYTLVQSPKNK